MSKLTELKSKLAHHVESLRFCEMELSGRKEKLEEIQAEIAAIEAQERKPRTWQMYLTDAGMLHPNTIYLGGPFGKTRHFEPITVIEKLPVKIDKKLAFRMRTAAPSECWNGDPVYWVSALRAAGIEAEPSND